jgi:hypothetical protein
MSPTIHRQRRAQLLAELQELDRLEALERTHLSQPKRREPLGSQPGTSETVNILGATWEVKRG